MMIGTGSRVRPRAASSTCDATYGDHPCGWRCAACGLPLTSEQHLAALGGSTEHQRVNPAGLCFRFRTFAQAPGASVVGVPTEQASWFPPRMWRLAQCARCVTHLGWCFGGAGTVPVFALINLRLCKDD